MPLKVINKISGKLKFLYRKNRFLSPELRRMLCNALIQQHFDYACPACYWKNEKKKQIMQNKCIRFCLRVDKMHYISEEDFSLINWLPTSKRVDQCINNITFKFVRVRIRGLEMFVFRKIWRALCSWNTRFEIRPFALLPTKYRRFYYYLSYIIADKNFVIFHFTL